MRILLVDDDRQYMPKVVEALEAKGNEVLHVRNLPEVQDATVEKFDCIILDMMVPPTRGIPAATTSGGYTAGHFLYDKVLRPAFPDTPFVILTAADDSVDSVRSSLDVLEKEMMYYERLKKPFVINDLTASLERAVARGRGR